jgi:hypothetical protein
MVTALVHEEKIIDCRDNDGDSKALVEKPCVMLLRNRLRCR